MKTLTKLDEAFRLSIRRPAINILRVASAVQDGETVTFGAVTFEVDFSATSAITAGRTRVDLSASPTLAAAGKAGTFSGTGTANDTITIAGQVYTLKGTLTGAANEVLIGADAAASRNNLVAAINAAAGAGTTYGTGTVANASVSAVATSTATLTLTARAKGTVGNALTLAESGTGFSWDSGATTLSGGVDATAAEFTTALVATTPENISMVRHSANEVLFIDTSRQGYSQAKACTETLAGSNNAWASATSYGYEAEGEEPKAQTMATRVPNAVEIALGSVHIPLTFAPSRVIVSVRVTSTGAAKGWTGNTVITGNRITLTNTGGTDFAATDTITVLAAE